MLPVKAGSDPSMGVSFAALVGMGSLEGFGLCSYGSGSHGSRMVPLLSATRMPHTRRLDAGQAAPQQLGAVS